MRRWKSWLGAVLLLVVQESTRAPSLADVPSDREEQLLRAFLRQNYEQEATTVIGLCYFAPWVLERSGGKYLGPVAPSKTVNCLEHVLALQSSLWRFYRFNEVIFNFPPELGPAIEGVVAYTWRDRIGSDSPAASRDDLVGALAYAAFLEVFIRDIYRQRAEFLK